MWMKFQIIREIHNKIQIDQKKKTLKWCKIDNKEMILKWNSIYDEL
jgi:hypothetical protein